MRSMNITPSIYDSIGSMIINRISNETYNSYFPVSGGNDDGKKDKKRKAIVILPSRKDEN